MLYIYVDCWKGEHPRARDGSLLHSEPRAPAPIYSNIKIIELLVIITTDMIIIIILLLLPTTMISIVCRKNCYQQKGTSCLKPCTPTEKVGGLRCRRFRVSGLFRV